MFLLANGTAAVFLWGRKGVGVIPSLRDRERCKKDRPAEEEKHFSKVKTAQWHLINCKVKAYIFTY